MNSTSLTDLRSESVERSLHDEKMEQVRELLFGDQLRRNEAQLAALQTRLDDLEMSFGRKLDALAARIEALAGTAEADRRSSFDELAKGVAELSERLRHVAQG